jgi:hypothetical protein
VKRLSAATILLLLLTAIGCGHQGAKSKQSFDEIRESVKGKTTVEVERMLGRPDTREPMLMSGERWIWWNYTYLDGNNYAPEERGRVVHLEVVFEPEKVGAVSTSARAVLRVGGPLGVSYTFPKQTM